MIDRMAKNTSNQPAKYRWAVDAGELHLLTELSALPGRERRAWVAASHGVQVQ